jgi:hypothetical protein
MAGKEMINKKKAQITAFIIVGIIILLFSAVFLYYRNVIIPEPELIPEDLMPIKNYIVSCLNNVGEDAVIRMGSQGGYIELPKEIILGQSYIELVPRSPIKIPYWYKNGISYVPNVELMQNQMSAYIEKNIKKCVDLSIFEDDYDIEDQDNIKVKTIIGDKNIDVELVYDLIIKDKATGEPTRISTHHTVIPVALKQVYELGQKILDAENSKNYFENITIDWISMSKDIPLNGLEFHCSDLKWKVKDVKKNLQDIVYYNTPLIRIKDTNHGGFLEDDEVYEELREYTLEDINKGDYPDIETPADAYEYSQYLLDVRTKKTDLKVGFLYDRDWGMDFVARPSENGIMQSSKQSASEEFLSFMCLNVYHFTYDVVYPVEVLIRDDKSFNNRGYVFRYVFPVMINHNQPDRSGFLNPEFVMLGGTSTGYCEELAGPEYDIIVYGVDEYGIANMELKDVNITYDCYKFNCYLGQTSAIDGRYRLKTQLPSSCANGFIIGKKDGYLNAKEQVLDSKDIDVDIKKLKTVDFEVRMSNYNAPTDDVQSDEIVKAPFRAIIDIQSIDEPSLSFFREYPLEDEKERTIDLIQQNSRYKIEIILFDEEDEIIIGGYKNNVTFSYNEIADGDKIIFKTAIPLPRNMNKIGEPDVFRFLEENNIYKDRFEPKLR